MRKTFLNRKFPYRYLNAVQILVMVNVIVYILTNLFDIRINGISLIYYLSLIPPFVRHGYVWQFVTYMFVHSDFSHIFFNMYALMIFGISLERAIGSYEFLLFYFLSGILGGVLNYIASVTGIVPMSVVLGASGAVYALMFLTAVLFPFNRVLLFFIFPMRLPLAVLVFILIEVTSQVMGTGAGVAHLIHLSSILVAWLYCIIRMNISPYKVFRSALR